MKITTTIIIPTLLSNYSLLSDCLNSLKQQTYKKFTTLVVVNSVQTKKSKEFFQKFDHVDVVYLETNEGFTGAVNTGIKKAKSNYIVLLNDDTKVHKDWLTELVNTQEKTGADMVASNIYLSDKKRIDSQGFSFAWRGKAVANSSGKNPLSQSKDYWLNPENKQILPNNSKWIEPFGPDAAACLYTKKLFDSVGLFNESFFAYLEDVELALRSRKKGMICAFAQNAIVYHCKHATSQKTSGFKQLQDFKNWWRIVLFTYPKVAWQKFSVIILIERIRNLKGLFK